MKYLKPIAFTAAVVYVMLYLQSKGKLPGFTS